MWYAVPADTELDQTLFCIPITIQTGANTIYVFRLSLTHEVGYIVSVPDPLWVEMDLAEVKI